MQSTVDKKRIACPSPEISAYIDGELSSHDELELEMHIAGCRVCADDLNLQKGFLNALDFSLEEERDIELPANFTKSVVANAESRVSGLRLPHERRSAAFICSALLVFAVLALGGNAATVFNGVTAIAERVFAVISSIGHLAYDLALGVGLVFRSLASAFVFESSLTMTAVLAIFVLSLYFFSRLLVRFRRNLNEPTS